VILYARRLRRYFLFIIIIIINQPLNLGILNASF
jgi:hypothetical protein